MTSSLHARLRNVDWIRNADTRRCTTTTTKKLFLMAGIPLRITLHSTTKMTLHERFGKLQEERSKNIALVASSRNIKSLDERFASMEAGSRKGNLSAAILKKRAALATLSAKDNSLQTVRAATFANRITRGRISNRLGKPLQVQNSIGRRLGGTFANRGRGVVSKPGASVGVLRAIVRGSMRGSATVRVALRENSVGDGFQTAPKTSSFRGKRGSARGGTRGWGVSKASRDQLDSQLDQYMSKTKSALDLELENYMAQVDNN